MVSVCRCSFLIRSTLNLTCSVMDVFADWSERLRSRPPWADRPPSTNTGYSKSKQALANPSSTINYRSAVQITYIRHLASQEKWNSHGYNYIIDVHSKFYTAYQWYFPLFTSHTNHSGNIEICAYHLNPMIIPSFSIQFSFIGNTNGMEKSGVLFRMRWRRGCL